MKFINLSLSLTLLLSSLTASVNKVQIGTSGVEPFKNKKVEDAYTLEITEEERDIGKASTSFNCETGAVDIAGSMADIEKEFDNLIKIFYDDPQKIIAEMVTQETTEMLLDSLALIHFQLSNSSEVTKAFDVFNSEKIKQCYTSVAKKSLVSEVEGGAGINIYDLFSGKLGINIAETLGILKCHRQGLFNGTDDESKKKWEASKKYVRNLFYKLLNESMSLNFKMKQSPKCKDLHKQLKDIKKKSTSTDKNNQNKEPEQVQPADLQISLSKLGEVRDLSGNKMFIQVEAKNVPIGYEDNTFSNKTPKSGDEKVANADYDSPNDKTKNNSIKYGTIISTTPTYKIAKDKIDVLDLTEEEIIFFNMNFIKDMKKLLNSNESFVNLNQNTKNSTIQALTKILTITTIKETKLQEHKCINSIKTEDIDKNCSIGIFSNYKDISATEIKVKINKKFKRELMNKTYKYNKLATGFIDSKVYARTSLSSLKMVKKGSVKDIIKLNQKKLAQITINNRSKFNNLKHFLSAGGKLFKNGETLYSNSNYEYDLINKLETNYTNNNINYSTSLFSPLNEFQYVRFLYEYEDITKLKILLGMNTQYSNYFIGKDGKLPKNNDNFIAIDTNKNYILSSGFKPIYDLKIKDLQYISNFIRNIKELYAQKLMEIINSRLEGIKTWQFNFQAENMANSSIRLFEKAEIKKIELKLLQRRLMIKLLLDKNIY